MVELLVLAMIALVVVGPKDLPRLMYQIGKGLRQVRKLADEFRAGFNEMAREAEIEEMRKEIEALKAANPAKDLKDELDDIDSAMMTPKAPAKTGPTARD
jgi:sec-independent protein translocase protein TatB